MGIPHNSADCSRVTHPYATDQGSKLPITVRLACFKHAASVRPEPGSTLHGKNYVKLSFTIDNEPNYGVQSLSKAPHYFIFRRPNTVQLSRSSFLYANDIKNTTRLPKPAMRREHPRSVYPKAKSIVLVSNLNVKCQLQIFVNKTKQQSTLPALPAGNETKYTRITTRCQALSETIFNRSEMIMC